MLTKYAARKFMKTENMLLLPSHHGKKADSWQDKTRKIYTHDNCILERSMGQKIIRGRNYKRN